MDKRLIPGFSQYIMDKDMVVTEVATGNNRTVVVHNEVVSINLVDDAGNKKRIKLINLFNRTFPEMVEGTTIQEAPDYKVRADGSVYSLIQGRCIKGAVNKAGYELLTLRDVKSVPFNQYMHILVAKAFVKGYFVGATVNHKDGNKRNNHKSNLEWITKVDNVKHAWKSGLCDSKHKKCEISKDGIEWIKFDKLVDAKTYLESTGAKLANVSHLVRAAKQNEGLETPKYLCRGFYVKYIK